jgi:hypothetical protein
LMMRAVMTGLGPKKLFSIRNSGSTALTLFSSAIVGS